MANNFIGIRVTPAEREKLEQLASANGIALSQYIKSQLNLDAEEPEAFSVTIQASENEKRECPYLIRLTPSEANKIETEAAMQQIPASALIRKKALSAKNIIHIDVYDNDIVDLEHRIQPKIDSFSGVVEALRMQSMLHDVQANKMEALLQGIYDELRYIAKRVRTNRSRLKEQRARLLQARIDQAIITNTDSKAVFDEFPDEEEM